MKIFLRYISIVLLLSCLAIQMPADAAPNVLIIEQEQQPALTVISDASVRVTNANGHTLYVYNVAGVCVQSLKIEGHDRRYDLNLPKGCYIVKVGKTVSKISIK